MKKILLLFARFCINDNNTGTNPYFFTFRKTGDKDISNPVQSGGTITIISPADFIPQSVVLGTFSGKPLVPFYRNGVTVQSTLPLPTSFPAVSIF